MLHITLDEKTGIATFKPDDSLSESDFKNAVHIIDPYINKFKKLNGLIIATKEFPGWKSFAALLSHLSFVKDHHKRIACVAFVTDSSIGNLAEPIASHFISAEVKVFKYNELQAAKTWITESNQ